MTEVVGLKPMYTQSKCILIPQFDYNDIFIVLFMVRIVNSDSHLCFPLLFYLYLKTGFLSNILKNFLDGLSFVFPRNNPSQELTGVELTNKIILTNY